jgi:hypothetical protein
MHAWKDGKVLEDCLIRAGAAHKWWSRFQQLDGGKKWKGAMRAVF